MRSLVTHIGIDPLWTFGPLTLGLTARGGVRVCPPSLVFSTSRSGSLESDHRKPGCFPRVLSRLAPTPVTSAARGAAVYR